MKAIAQNRLKVWAIGIGCGIVALAGSVAISPAIAQRTFVDGGVSGDTSDNDERAACAGIDAAGFSAETG